MPRQQLQVSNTKSSNCKEININNGVPTDTTSESESNRPTDSLSTNSGPQGSNKHSHHDLKAVCVSVYLLCLKLTIKYTIYHYCQALRTSQLESSCLCDKIKALQLKCGELESANKDLKKAAKESQLALGSNNNLAKASSSIGSKDELISLLGHKFGVLNEMCLPSSVFMCSMPKNMHSDDLWHYDKGNEVYAEQGLIAKLYKEVTDPGLRSIMERHSHFQDIVSLNSVCIIRELN